MDYGILIMVYISVERYMKVVHGRTIFERMAQAEGELTRRRCISLMCACLPALCALMDMYHYTTIATGPGAQICTDTSIPTVRSIVFWIRTIICVITPCAVLLVCNGAVTCTVRNHVQRVSSAVRGHRSLKGAQVLPLLTVALFLCCWIPWIVTSAHYALNRPPQHEYLIMFVVTNVSLAIGHMHCITTPALYLSIRVPKTRVSRHLSSSSQCRGTDTVSSV